jgi:two-component system, NtrC family, nitrogen regulation response regulator NtrX
MPGEILIVDDEVALLRSLRSTLEMEGYGVLGASTAGEGMAQLAECDLVLLDVRLPDRNGIELLADIRKKTDVPVVMMSAHATIADAVRATQLGAHDFLEKPFTTERVLLVVRNALLVRRLETDRAELEARAGVGGQLLGDSLAMRRARDQIRLCAGTPGRVLITGETGTGKEMVARAIHAQSDRRTAPWVAVNCAAVPHDLIESELFGHEKGAFTGALRTRRGKFEQADGGTLFLDEIGDMPAHMQAKLLRVLEEGEIERVGGDRRLRVDVRVLSATNRELRADIAAGRFREDLFHRLNVVNIHLAPLRERPEDIPVLVAHFVETLSRLAGLRAVDIAPDLMVRLQAHPWPGNVRELRNTIERLLIFSQGRAPGMALLEEVLGATAGKRASEALELGGTGFGTAWPAPGAQLGSTYDAGEPGALDAMEAESETGGAPVLIGAAAAASLRQAVEEFERRHILERLRAHGGQVAATARELGLERSHLYKKMRALGINPDEAR